MLKKIVQNFMAPRHFWRDDALAYAQAARSKLIVHVPDGFDELSELYVNALFRGLALSVTGLFIPIYLLQLGYDITAILVVVAWYFTFRGLATDILSGYTVARIGPKHTIAVGYFLQIASSGLFLTLGSRNWPIWLLGGMWGAASSYFFVPFNVSFSKVKHSKYGGKELSYLNIMTRLGRVLGPVLGAAVATIFGGQYIFLAAGLLLLLGLVPLLRTAEPVKLKQKLRFRDLQVGPIKRDIISFAAIGSENTLMLYMWPLFLGLFILSGSTAYARLGALATTSVIIGAVTAYLFGKLIDKGYGRRVLQISAFSNAGLHIVRIFTSSYLMAFGVNIVNEAVTDGYRVAYFKGYYDAADNQKGLRIVYFACMESIASIARAAQWWLFTILSTLFAARTVTSLAFLVAAVVSILITTERFKGLNPKPIIK